MNSRTSAIVSSSCATPRWLSASHCNGTSTSSAAVSPLTVSTPSDGGQSMSTVSNGVAHRVDRARRARARDRCASRRCTSEPARSMLAGSRRTRPASTIASSAFTRCSSTSCSVGAHCSGSRPSANVRHACGSRSTRSTRSPRSASARPEGLGRRGLGDAALLVGDREDPRHGRGVYEWRRRRGPRAGHPRRSASA